MGAMAQMSASGPAPESTAALLAGYLHPAGVRHVFGYPGESVIDFMEAARHRDIRVDSVAGLQKALAGFGTRSRPLIVEARVDPSQYEAQF
jgi:thiamine pyrophosphate-dependent acetolactate synthase large subunit-like protein